MKWDDLAVMWVICPDGTAVAYYLGDSQLFELMAIRPGDRAAICGRRAVCRRATAHTRWFEFAKPLPPYKAKTVIGPDGKKRTYPVRWDHTDDDSED